MSDDMVGVILFFILLYVMYKAIDGEKELAQVKENKPIEESIDNKSNDLDKVKTQNIVEIEKDIATDIKENDKERLEVSLTPEKYLTDIGILAREKLYNLKLLTILVIKHEADNIYDSKAIQVFYDGIEIGYILKWNTEGKVDKFCFRNNTLIKNIQLVWENSKLFLIKSNSYFTCNSFNKILDDYQIKYIYHMTHINNLKNILNNGLLSHNNSFVKRTIDNPQVNSRRDFLEPIYNKNLHEYVPFYFNPKNPMLYVNKDKAEDIIILAFNRKLIYQNNSLFTDGNASVNITNFFNDINDLDNLNWDCLRGEYWNDFEDGKREIMSEVLIPNKVDINHLEKIFVNNNDNKKLTKNLLVNYQHIILEINNSIFFNKTRVRKLKMNSFRNNSNVAKSTSPLSTENPDTYIMNMSLYLEGEVNVELDVRPIRLNKDYAGCFVSESSYAKNIRVYPVTRLLPSITNEKYNDEADENDTPKTSDTMNMNPRLLVDLGKDVGYIIVGVSIIKLLDSLIYSYQATVTKKFNKAGVEVTDYKAMIDSTEKNAYKRNPKTGRIVKCRFGEIAMRILDVLEDYIAEGGAEVMLHKKSPALASQDWIKQVLILREEIAADKLDSNANTRTTYPEVSDEAWYEAMPILETH